MSQEKYIGMDVHATIEGIRLIAAHPELADHPPRERLPGSGARDQHPQWERHDED